MTVSLASKFVTVPHWDLFEIEDNCLGQTL